MAAVYGGWVRPIDGEAGYENTNDRQQAKLKGTWSDLNGDGQITTMLVADPEGSWLLTEDEPPLPKQADTAKGEKGLYLKMTEGQDDDGDGHFNEDSAGDNRSQRESQPRKLGQDSISHGIAIEDAVVFETFGVGLKHVILALDRDHH